MSTTDHELLELAAKAAGIAVEADGNFAFPHRLWNPLTDDGDALRLAVQLGLVVCVLNEIGKTGIYLPAEHIGGKYDELEEHGDDPHAATRRAIVRAAAEIGKAMP